MMLKECLITSYVVFFMHTLLCASASSSTPSLSTENDDPNCIEVRKAPKIWWAASEGNISRVLSLLRSGAEVDIATSNGLTSLYIASHNGHNDVVDLLLTYGAERLIADGRGMTPLHAAVQKQRVDVVTRLIKNPSASLVNAATISGMTPLHQAAGNGNVRIAELLLAAGAHASVCDAQGGTPLHMAAYYGHSKIIECLIPHVAGYINQANKLGATPLYIACERGHLDAVDQLINAGADVTLATNEKITPLHIASDLGHRAVVLRLLAAKAPVDMVDYEGVTPLHLAAQSGQAAIAKLLIESGADITRRTPDSEAVTYRNMLPEEIAAVQHDQATSLFLKQYRTGDAIPVVLTDDVDGHAERCSICLEHWEDNELGMRLSCGHIFHKSPCLDTLCKNASACCPVCRAPIGSLAQQSYVVFKMPERKTEKRIERSDSDAEEDGASSSYSADRSVRQRQE